MEIKLLSVREATGNKLTTPKAVWQEMKAEAQADRECFWVLHLNTKMAIIEKELVAMGRLDAATIHPRETFRKAVINSTHSIATVHNHPSGDTTPSEDDRRTWKMLKQAGDILGIELVDNLIISSTGYYSDKENGG